MPTCKQCGGEETNRLVPDLCMPCIETAMDAMTLADIAEAMNDLASRGTAVRLVSSDGSDERVDPSKFFWTD